MKRLVFSLQMSIAGYAQLSLTAPRNRSDNTTVDRAEVVVELPSKQPEVPFVS